MSLLKKKWYTVDQPWGDGGWAIAGHHDPHFGTPVFDCHQIAENHEYSEKGKAMAATIASHIVDLHNASLMDDKSKTQALTALVASAFTQYKKIMYQDINDTHIPPSPAETREEYCNDPLIHRCVDAVVAGIGQIMVR